MEELTTKMHSEFTVSEAIDIKHRCFCALDNLQDNDSIQTVTRRYNVTEEQIQSHKAEFELLSSK